jgi:hypothetical protein
MKGTSHAHLQHRHGNQPNCRPYKGAAIKEAGANGTAFATEAELSEATALWPASRLVDVWNGFAGAPPFAELKEVKRFTDRKSAVVRIRSEEHTSELQSL